MTLEGKLSNASRVGSPHQAGVMAGPSTASSSDQEGWSDMITEVLVNRGYKDVRKMGANDEPGIYGIPY